METEIIKNQDQPLAIIVYSTFSQSGVHFFTSHDLSQQLAYMKHPKGKMIEPHIHNRVKREVYYTQETLFIKSGRLRVDFYTEFKQYIDCRVLSKGDLILLITGGHGFEILEETEMIEVKQGPYAGDQDKTRFTKQI